MIRVDSSVWIAQLRRQNSSATAKLGAAAGREALLIGDLILLEVLQGARDESHAVKIEHDHALLHDDRDFAPMKQHLGLMVA